MSWTRNRPPNTIVTPTMARLVIRAYGTECYICGAPYRQIDHVVPWSRGGPTVVENLRPICDDCHQYKSEQEKKAGFQRYRAKAKRPKEKHPSEE